MAGDWIKIRTDLSDDPDVYMLSDILGIDCPTVVGHLVAFWGWMNRHTADGKSLKLSDSVIDKRISVTGFASALKEIGWLVGENMNLEIPNYERHNGSSAKARALESEAKRIRRAGKGVGQGSDKKGPKCPTREEKRREEKSKDKPSSNKFSDEDLALSEKIYFHVKQVTNKTRKPNFEKWADTIRLMREQDKHSFDEIQQVFLFANSDEFWKTNILSPEKLRKQFSQLHAKMINGGGHASSNGNYQSKPDALEESARNAGIFTGSGRTLDGNFEVVG